MRDFSNDIWLSANALLKEQLEYLAVSNPDEDSQHGLLFEGSLAPLLQLRGAIHQPGTGLHPFGHYDFTTK